MPQCCVPGCKSVKGTVSLKCFPKNEELCAQWVHNLKRPNFIPTQNHRICLLHFAPEMWEKTRVDGTRKLKWNAVPTIFGEKIRNKNNNARNVGMSPDNHIPENKKKPMRVVPSKYIESSQPILIPSSVIKTQTFNSPHTILIDKQGKIIDPSTMSKVIQGSNILKKASKSVKSQPSQMIISRNPSVLKHQIEASSNRMPIVIPANASIVKSGGENVDSEPPVIDITDTETNDIFDNQASFINPTETFNTNVTRLRPDVESMDICSNDDSLDNDQQINYSGIVLNKAEAKKMEDERFERMDRLLLQQLKMNNALRKKLTSMKNKIQQMMREKDHNYKDLMRNVFTEDQIRALELKHTNPKALATWSNKTMVKAIRLKELCGSIGYDELLKQNLPLPSVRTISRWCTSKNIPVP